MRQSSFSEDLFNRKDVNQIKKKNSNEMVRIMTPSTGELMRMPFGEADNSVTSCRSPLPVFSFSLIPVLNWTQEKYIPTKTRKINTMKIIRAESSCHWNTFCL